MKRGRRVIGHVKKKERKTRKKMEATRNVEVTSKKDFTVKFSEKERLSTQGEAMEENIHRRKKIRIPPTRVKIIIKVDSCEERPRE